MAIHHIPDPGPFPSRSPSCDARMMADRARALADLEDMLRRGVTTTRDRDDIGSLFATAFDAQGLGLSDGFGFARPGGHYAEIPDEWIETHRHHAHLDPSHRVFAAGNDVCHVQADATPDERNREIHELFESYFADAAVVRARTTDERFVFVCAYRRRRARPFTRTEVGRIRLLVPWISAAFSTRSALAALNGVDLPNLGHVEVTHPSGAMRWSKKARAFVASSIVERGSGMTWKHVEAAVRRAVKRFFAEGVRARWTSLRYDVALEMSLLPRERSDEVRVLVTFVEAHPAPPAENAPCEELLSPRQRDVVRLVVTGKSLPAIARQLGLARDTVRLHFREARRRLGVRTRAELVSLIRS